MDLAMMNVTLPMAPEFDPEDEELAIALWIACAVLVVLSALMMCLSCCTNAWRKWSYISTRGESKPAALILRNISVSWGSGEKAARVLQGINAYVFPGEMMAIMGPSGSGKTTLLKSIAGSPEVARANISGSISLNGKDQTRSLLQQRLCGYVPQFACLPADISVEEAAHYQAAFQIGATHSRKDRLAHVDKVLDWVELGHIKKNMLRSGGGGISGGQAQRLMLACHGLMAASCKLLLADEPTTGLSSSDSEVVMSLLSKLAKEQQYSVIVTIHQPSASIFQRFDRVLLLSNSRVAYLGRPQHEMMSGFLRHSWRFAHNKLDLKIDREKMRLPPGENIANSVMDILNDEGCEKAMIEYFDQEHRAVLEQHLYQRAQLEGEGDETAPWTGIGANLYFMWFVLKCFLIECWAWFHLLSLLVVRRASLSWVILAAVTAQALFIALVYLQLETDVVADARSLLGVCYAVLASQVAWASWIGYYVELFPIVQMSMQRSHFSAASYQLAWMLTTVWRVTAVSIIAIVLQFFLVGFDLSFKMFFVLVAMRLILDIFIHMFASTAAQFNSIALGLMLSSATLAILTSYSGLFTSPTDFPVFLKWMYNINPMAYALEAIAWTEFDTREFECDEPGCPIDAVVVLDELGFKNRLSMDFAFVILVTTLFVTIFVGALMLRQLYYEWLMSGAVESVPNPVPLKADSAENADALTGSLGPKRKYSLTNTGGNELEDSDAVMRRDLDSVLHERFVASQERMGEQLQRRMSSGKLSPRRSGGASPRLRSLSGGLGSMIGFSPKRGDGGGSDVDEPAPAPAEDDTPWQAFRPLESSDHMSCEMDVRNALSFKLECKNVSAFYYTGRELTRSFPFIARKRKHAVKHVNCIFNAGQMHAIMGPSGSGKSSLIQALAGIGNVYVKGEISLNGVTLKEGLLESGIGKLLTQYEIMDENLTVSEQMQIASDLQMGGSAAEKAKLQTALLQLLKLDHRMDLQVMGLSGGQKKRLALLVDVLLSESRVLLLDEPTSGLSSVDSAELISMLRYLVDNWSYTVIMTIHQPRQQIFNSFHSVMVMKSGRVVMQSSPRNIHTYLKTVGLKDRFLATAEAMLMQTDTDEAADTMREFFRDRPVISVHAEREDVENFRPYHAGLFTEVLTLTHREILRQRRTLKLPISFMIQLLYAALLIGLLGVQTDLDSDSLNNLLGVTFQFTLFCAYSYTSFVNNRISSWQVRRHERVLGRYSLWVSVAIEAGVSWMRVFFLVPIPLCVFYFIVGVRYSAVYFFTFMWGIVLVCIVTEALCTMFIMATNLDALFWTTFVTVFMACSWSVAGFYIFPDDLGAHIGWTRFLSVYYYCVEMNFSSVLQNREIDCVDDDVDFSCPIEGSDFLDDAGFRIDSIPQNMIIVLAAAIFFTTIAVLAEYFWEWMSKPTYDEHNEAPADVEMTPIGNDDVVSV